ncbi:MAG TPA: isopentenyl-diphosphate Delta-isomerase [Nitrososphaerales archaeon]|nr:isopentenyl-diphosphate Delta-isomerase [Nitrososphaerales archaeon]
MLSEQQQQVEWLVLVDDNDKELGLDTRENCHRGMGKRHRAFVVFLYDKGGRMLLQKRSMKKKLWPAYWDVSVTSHVYKGETYEEAGIRRSKQELSADVKKLERRLDYTYWAKFGDYSENEFCVLLTGTLEGPARPNPEEIMETEYITMDELGADMSKNPDKYTPWFKIAFEKYAQQKAR